MYTDPVSAARLAESVWAVPPLARHDDFSLNHEANRQMIAHLEAGGMTSLLYGGNAIMYHVALSEYRELLELLASAAAPETLIVPSVGPAFGTMMDQAAVLADFSFPTAMILPQGDVASSAGIAMAVARFVDRFGKPVVLYIRHDRAVEPETAGGLMDDGLLVAIKYAVARDDPGKDDYLRALVDAAGPERMLSGLGDQPAPVHMRQFGLASFTTGCGCVAPRSCMALLSAIRTGDDRLVAEILERFAPLENLRNRLGPITVLHEAISQAGIADMGPIIPLLSPIDPRHHDAIRRAAKELLERD